MSRPSTQTTAYERTHEVLAHLLFGFVASWNLELGGLQTDRVVSALIHEVVR
jgi:hypothetical protein